MAFRRGIGSTRFECLFHQCRRWYCSVISGARASVDRPDVRWKIGIPEMPSGLSAYRSPWMQYTAVRFFAAPVQVKPKPELKEQHGPRINEAIKAEYVRLVTDEGHGIVSRREALDRAKKLNLDLVEVDRTAKPLVCKIMDFHKEKYKKENMEKSRSKSKSDVTLRKGAGKEVRFLGKIEQKDLQMKAEMVKRLMERGYRVKCMAMGTEEEDLGSLLLRFTALIEDVSYVESGPRVEKKQAYVIVRHAKFGPSKKNSGKKAGKIVESMSSGAQRAASISTATIISSSQHQVPCLDEEELEPTDSSLETEDEVLSDQVEPDAQHLSTAPSTNPIEMPDGDLSDKMAWSGFDVTDDFEKVFDLNADGSGTGSSSTQSLDILDTFSSFDDIDAAQSLHQKLPPDSSVGGSGLKLTPLDSKPVLGSVKAKSEFQKERMDRHIPTSPVAPWSKPSPSDSNWFQQMKSAEQSSTVAQTKVMHDISGFSSAIQKNQFNRSVGGTELQGVGQQRPNQGRIPRQHLGVESQKHGQMDLKQEQAPLGNPSPPAPSYGIFSTTKSTDDQRKSADANRDKGKCLLSNNNDSINPSKLKVEIPRKDNEKPRQGGWGVFSTESSSINQRSNSDSQLKVQR